MVRLTEVTDMKSSYVTYKTYYNGETRMEIAIRGILEKHIDSLAQPERLEGLAIIFESFQVKSIEDCLFGFVVGSAFLQFATLIGSMGSQPRQATDDEMKEFWEIIMRRTLEIKGKIKLALSR